MVRNSLLILHEPTETLKTISITHFHVKTLNNFTIRELPPCTFGFVSRKLAFSLRLCPSRNHGRSTFYLSTTSDDGWIFDENSSGATFTIISVLTAFDVGRKWEVFNYERADDSRYECVRDAMDFGVLAPRKSYFIDE